MKQAQIFDKRKSSSSVIFDSWQLENRLSYSIWRLLDPASIDSLANFNQLHSTVKNIICLEDSLNLNTSLVSKLSRNSLSMLTELNLDVFEGFSNELLSAKISQIYKKKVAHQDGTNSYFSKLKNIVSIIINSDLPAPFIISICGDKLDKNWRKIKWNAKLSAALEQTLQIIRSSDPIDNKLFAAEIFYDSLIAHNQIHIADIWSEVGREIIARLVNWPLIVLPSRTTSATHGFTVPITLDIHYDNKGRNVCINTDDLAQFDWGVSLNRARVVANKFWASQHTRIPDHKERTQNRNNNLRPFSRGRHDKKHGCIAVQ